MIQGALLIALAALLWATTGIVAKFLFTGTELQAITLGFLRLAVALPFFWLLMRREQARLERANPGAKVPGSSLRSLTRKTLIPLAALGLFQAFYQGSYLLAVDLTGAGIATLIALCLPPVLVAILAAPLLGEKPSLLTVLSLFAAIAGTAMGDHGHCCEISVYRYRTAGHYVGLPATGRGFAVFLAADATGAGTP